jgi:hypothetical protein
MKKRNDEAEDIEEIRQVISAGRYPGLRRFNFVFDTDAHLLYFESMNSAGQSFAPKWVKRAFDNFFTSKIIREQFDDVEVTVVPAPGTVDTLLSLPGLSYVKIHLQRPNADDQGHEYAEALKRLSRQRLRSEDRILYKDRKADSILPDEDTKNLASIAAENGYVEVKARKDDGTIVTDSTRDRPRMDYLLFDALSIQPLDKLLHHAGAPMRLHRRR